MLMRAIVGPDDIVVYPEPTYSLYDTLVTIQEGRVAHHPVPGRLRAPAGVGAAEGRLMIICNPNAPSGTLTPLDDIAELARRVRRRRGGRRSLRRLRARARAGAARDRIANVVVLRTFSKSFSLAGMRIGLAVRRSRRSSTRSAR